MTIIITCLPHRLSEMRSRDVISALTISELFSAPYRAGCFETVDRLRAWHFIVLLLKCQGGGGKGKNGQDSDFKWPYIKLEFTKAIKLSR